MKNLLELALEAHGGLTRWSQLKGVTADLSVTGALWQMKGQVGALQQIRIQAELHRQELTTHFHGRDKRTTFTPDSVTLQTEGGRLLQSRANPRRVDGISVPMKRRVYSYDADKRKIPEPVLVAIDIHAIAFSRS